MKKMALTLTATIVLALGIAACIVLPQYAQNYFYYPTQEHSGYTPEREELAFEIVNFASADGTMLNGWFVPATGVASTHTAKGTVLQVHGNAGNISDHWYFTNWLPQQGYNVLVFDYRGYGHSDHTPPTPQGLFHDTQAAIRYLQNRPDIDPQKLLILGQSLGGNNAISAIGAMSAAQRKGICSIVIDSTFLSYSSIGDEKFSSAGSFMNDNYSAQHYITALAPIPLLFLHGTADKVIPFEHSQRLYELATSPKEIIIIPNGEHLSALSHVHGDVYKNKVLAFFEQSLQTCPDLN